VAGRFPLYTDADIHGPLIDALVRAGWDVARAVERYPEAERDETHFQCAARENRVLVSNDPDQLVIALDWIASRRPFRGLIRWEKTREGRRMPVGRFVDAFEELAGRPGDPFAGNPIVYLKPKA